MSARPDVPLVLAADTAHALHRLGHPPTVIAAALNAAQLAPTTGRRWTPRAVTSLLAPTSARAAIAQLRDDGATWSTIARTLNGRGVPTPSGRGRWYPETARRHADPASHAAYMRAWRAHRAGTWPRSR